MKKLSIIILLAALVGSANAQMKYWIYPNKKIDFTGASPSVSVISSIPSGNANQISDAAYDQNNNLLFYVEGWTVYNANGTQIGYLRPYIKSTYNPSYACEGAFLQDNRKNLIIVPEIGTCRKFKIYYVVNQCLTSSLLLTGNVDCTGANPVFSYVTSTTEYNPTTGLFDNPLPVTTLLPGVNPGITISKLQSNNTRFLYTVSYGEIKKHIISSSGISAPTVYNQSNVSGYHELTELEYFENSSTRFLCWVENDNTLRRFNLDLTTGNVISTGSFSYTLPYSGLNSVTGIEVDPTNPSYVYICTNLGVYKQQFAATAGSLVSGSTSYTNSNIEYAKDGYMYLISNTGVFGKINLSTSTISTASIDITPVTEPPFTSFRLPNQMDGENYNFFPTQPAAVTISNFTLNSTTLSNTCGSLTNINNFTPVLFNATTSPAATQHRIEIKALDASCNPVTGTGLINYVGGWISGAPAANWNIGTLTDANGKKLDNITGKVRVTYFVRNACNIESSLSKNINLVAPPATMTINGPSCHNGTAYTIGSSPAIPANSNVIWTVSPSGVATPVPNGTSCTFSSYGNGTITLTATLGSTVATKVITFGYPYTVYPAVDPLNPRVALMESDWSEGPCNSQCYSTTGPTIWWNAPVAHNSTGDTWQKVVSFPANYSSWSPGTNQIGMFFKGPNQSVEFRRTLTNACGSTIQYYCFGSTTSSCSVMRAQQPITTKLKVYPNPVSANKTLSIEIITEEDKALKTSFENCLIQLLDAKENVVLQKQGSNVLTESLDLPSLTNGTYYVRVVNKNGYQSEQIIIKN